jgi:hypothetical protein
MARKKSGGEGGGNAILVVFLVLFILLSIGLGVVVWTDQSKMAEAKSKEEAAIKKAGDETSAREAAELKTKMYRVFVHGGNENDRESIQKPGKHADALKEEHTALLLAANNSVSKSVGEVRAGPDGKPIEQLGGAGPFAVTRDELFTWPWPTTAEGSLAATPRPGTLFDRMVKLVAERERTYFESAAAKKTAADQAVAYNKQKDEYTTALTNLQTQVNAKITELDGKMKAVEDEKKKAIDEFVAKGEGARKQVADKAREFDDKVAELKAEQERVVNLSRQVQSMVERQTEIDQEKRGVFPVNVPHGTITRRDANGSIVEIDIGSDAGLKPGQTFTVQPASARTQGLAKQKKTSYDAEGRLVVSDQIGNKGAIEVISVDGPRQATARITEESEAIRDSILKGDLLYNPLFRKNAKDHIVLVGIFDMNADGQDDITEVVRNLAKRGAIVDGYYDLATQKWESLDPNNKKPGPGANTTYVVRGWDFEDQANDAALLAAKSRLRNDINTALTAAKLKGAQEVKAARFFTEIGYSFSPSISDETTSAAAVKYLKDNPAPAPK